MPLWVTDDPGRLAEASQRLLDDPRWHANMIRSAMTGGQISARDRRARFATLDLYEAEGGRTTRDLFSDAAWLHDEALLDRLFARRLAEEEAQAAEAGGWGFSLRTHFAYPGDDPVVRGYDQVAPDPVDLPEGDQRELEELSEAEDLTEEQAARLLELEARARGDFDEEARKALGILVYVDWQGRLKTLEGLRRKAGKVAGSKAGADGAEGGAAPAAAHEPDLSQALREDFLTIRRCALQTALLKKPELMLDFAAFVLDFTEHHHAYGLSGLSVAVQNVHPGVADGLAIVPALQRNDARDFERPSARAFATFRDREGARKLRNEILTTHLARSVMGLPGDLTDLLENLAQADIRSIWQPNVANCFGRLPAAALVAIYRELLDPADDDERFAAFRAMKRKDQAKELDGLFNDHAVREAYGISRDTAARIDAWVPEIMRRQS